VASARVRRCAARTKNFDFGKFASPTQPGHAAPGGISRIRPKTWSSPAAARTLVTLFRWRSSAGRRGVVVVSRSATKLCLLHYWFSASASLAATVHRECLFWFFFIFPHGAVRLLIFFRIDFSPFVVPPIVLRFPPSVFSHRSIARPPESQSTQPVLHIRWRTHVNRVSRWATSR